MRMAIECGSPGEPRLLLRRGLLLPVVVSRPTSRKNAPNGTQDSNGISINGLIDTGAVRSCLDLMFTRSLELPVVGREHVAGVHGIQDANLYMAEISVAQLNMKIRGRFIGLPLELAGLPRVLLGRDFLSRLKMVYDGRSGSVTLTVSIE